ncbi:MAG: hypothetical protein ABI967_03155 [bacterium]
MNRYRLTIIFTTLICFIAVAVSSAAAQHGFSVKQYNEFHEVLHPLEHEALPGNDFARIRARSSELVKHGQAIVKLGVPAGTSDDQKAEFKKELAKFDKALKIFRTHSRKGSDAQLKTSFSNVHDSFEMLASMLPRS